MKKILTFFVSALTFMATAQAPTNGLVVYYPFCGNANDYSGNNFHLTPTGNPQLTTDRFNTPAQSYSFNGVSDVFTTNNYGPMNQHSRSVAFWAKTSQAADMDGQAVLFYGDNQNGFGSRFEVGLNAQCN